MRLRVGRKYWTRGFSDVKPPVLPMLKGPLSACSGSECTFTDLDGLTWRPNGRYHYSDKGGECGWDLVREDKPPVKPLTERQRFERWAKRNGYPVDRSDACYGNLPTNWVWEAWQASRRVKR